MTKPQKNMYQEAIIWNVFVGCKFACTYCKKSFQAQMKRQKPMIDKNGRERGCQDCYDYTPHFHHDRLYNKLPKTTGDQFIWVGSSGDISFIDNSEMILILKRISEYPDRTFFFQTKNPIWFNRWEFPNNIILGITLESNITYPERISKAPPPWRRSLEFSLIKHPRKSITIEPILEFDFEIFYDWIEHTNPERVYIGYNSKPKNCRLPEPSLLKVKKLIRELRRFTKVKTKLLREAIK